MAIEIKLPDLGDGIESGDILEVLVSEGDVIDKDQGVVELETDKATVEVPSSHAGTVTKIHVSEGQTVGIGATLITLETTAAENSPEPVAEDSPAETEPSRAAQAEPPTPPAQPAPTRARVSSAKQPPDAPKSSDEPLVAPIQASVAAAHAPQQTELAPAGPAIRRFAREVGVDLTTVTGTGPGGRITRDDILAIVRKAGQGYHSDSTPAPATPETPDAEAAPVKAASDIDHPPAAEDEETRDSWGPIEVEKMAKIRKTIAAKMFESWSTVPRVTNFDDADVTELERIRQTSKADYAAVGIKLTSMSFLIKSVALALRSHPLLNAAIDSENQQIIYKRYINLGIAVDTDRGLVVPSLRDADDMSISDIARALGEIAENVRSGNFQVDDLRGGTFTISNLGAIGGAYSTPIINTPEVGILLAGRSRKMAVVVDDQVAVRLMMPLSLSYDHRVVDGATAARFLNDVIGHLQDPTRLLLAP